MARAATARLKCNPPLGRMPVLQFLRPDELQIDPAYQRSIEASESQTLIRKIAQHWNWDLCLSLVVARRATGELFVIDGQHRLEAAKLRRDIAHLPCIVGDYASAADEAASFVHLNQQRRPLSRIDLFKAALASDDPQALAILAAMEAAGLALAPHSNPTAWKPGMVGSVAGIELAWRTVGPLATGEALQCLATAFAGEVLVYAGTIFPGIVAVCARECADGKPLDPGKFATFTARLGARGQQQLRKDVIFEQAELGRVKAAIKIVGALFDGERPAATPVPAPPRVPQSAFVFKPDGKGDGPGGVGDGMAWCDQCEMRVTGAQATGCKSRWCSLKARA